MERRVKQVTFQSHLRNDIDVVSQCKCFIGLWLRLRGCMGERNKQKF